MKSSENKIILICYICENVNYKRKIEEENSHVILLKLDKGFAVNNVVGLYRTFKIEENETALSQAKKQLKNITDCIQDFDVNLILGISILILKKEEKTITNIEEFMMNGWKLEQLLISFS